MQGWSGGILDVNQLPHVPPSLSFSKGEFLLQPLTVAYKVLSLFSH